MLIESSYSSAALLEVSVNHIRLDIKKLDIMLLLTNCEVHTGKLFEPQV